MYRIQSSNDEIPVKKSFCRRLFNRKQQKSPSEATTILGLVKTNTKEFFCI